MSVLALVLVGIVGMTVYAIVVLNKKSNYTSKRYLIILKNIRSLGVFGFVIGLLGQFIGLFSAFKAVKMGQIEGTTSLFVEGFKISMIPAVFGVLLFVFSMVVWLFLKKLRVKI